MRLTRIIMLLSIATSVMGCGGGPRRAEARAHQASADVSSGRLKLVDQYQGCVKKAGEDVQKVEACDSFLRAAVALK